MSGGWYQVAYEREITGALTPVSLAGRELMLVRTERGLSVYDAYCPHRGADLRRGGRLCEGAIVCPFHGRRIGLDRPAEDGFFVRGYRTLVVGGLVFVLLSEAHDHGFARRMEQLDESHFFVPGFTLRLRTRPEHVIENAFDVRHFQQVHGLDETPVLELVESRGGELAVLGRFVTSRANPWQDKGRGAPGGIDFLARVYSPTLCVTELGAGEREYAVLTAATPVSAEECVLRVSVAAPAGPAGAPPAEEPIRALLRDSRAAIEQDKAIWEHLARDFPSRYTPEDRILLAFYEFCRRFSREERP
ncbi:MAG TPA: Rieske 2Fe-2S domain-containing protein [Archangium sp.]|nr:Rieske 2Fe-2S domain-containing protein [Archangium sp.]